MAINVTLLQTFFNEIETQEEIKRGATIQMKDSFAAFSEANSIDKKGLKKLYRDYKELRKNQAEYISSEAAKDQLISLFIVTPVEPVVERGE